MLNQLLEFGDLSLELLHLVKESGRVANDVGNLFVRDGFGRGCRKNVFSLKVGITSM